MIVAFLIYCVVSVALGFLLAFWIRFDRWLHDTKRKITFSPNKDSLGYLIAFVLGCPILNVLAILVFLILTQRKTRT